MQHEFVTWAIVVWGLCNTWHQISVSMYSWNGTFRLHFEVAIALSALVRRRVVLLNTYRRFNISYCRKLLFKIFHLAFLVVSVVIRGEVWSDCFKWNGRWILFSKIEKSGGRVVVARLIPHQLPPQFWFFFVVVIRFSPDSRNPAPYS